MSDTPDETTTDDETPVSPDEQMAEDEAEAEEGEGPLDDVVDEDALEPIPQPAGDEVEGEQQASMNAKIRQLEGEHTRRLKAFTKILGDEFAAYSECPMCAAMGYVVAPPLRQDSNVKRCEHCGGRGEVATGAFPPGEAVRQCPVCIGNGHVPSTQQVGPQFSSTPGTAPTNGTTVVVPAAPVAEPPEVAKLRELGYVVVTPFVEGAVS